jgi:hypothetical protein
LLRIQVLIIIFARKLGGIALTIAILSVPNKTSGTRVVCWFKASAFAVPCVEIKVFQAFLGFTLAGTI